jgi:predicted branched-subunit amino acid permease
VVEMSDRVPQAPSVQVEPPPAPARAATRWKSMILMLITAIIISSLAGILAHAAGSNIPAAILTSGGAFAGAFGLLLTMAHYAGSR